MAPLKNVLLSAVAVAAIGGSLTYFALPAFGVEPTAEEILRQTANQAKATTSSHATLTLTTNDTRIAGPIVVEVWAEKPDKGRAEVKQAPLTELQGIIAVTDGQNGWLYDKSKNRVITGSKADITQHAAGQALTWDQAVDKLIAESNAKLLRSERVDNVDSYVLELTPRVVTDTTRQGSATVWIEKARSIPIKATFASDKGNGTVVAKNIEINPKLDAALWKFTPPAGAEIVPASSLKPQTLTLDQARSLPGVLIPTVLPTGASLTRIEKVSDSVIQRYAAGTAEFVVWSGSGTGPAPLAGRDAQTVTVRGQTATQVSANGQTALSWRENGRSYVVAGVISAEDSRKVAESLR